jgi:hypothetical protein
MADLHAKQPDWQKKIRCPRLGGLVSFEYCKVESGELPCSRTLTCWELVFDVEGFLRGSMNPAAFEECFRDAVKPKVVTLIELIEQARQTLKKKDES